MARLPAVMRGRPETAPRQLVVPVHAAADVAAAGDAALQRIESPAHGTQASAGVAKPLLGPRWVAIEAASFVVGGIALVVRLAEHLQERKCPSVENRAVGIGDVLGHVDLLAQARPKTRQHARAVSCPKDGR
jgi:hypothetical protein